MILYLAIIEDRHTDVEVQVFDTAEKAIAYAKESARELNHHPEDLLENDDLPEDERVDEWLYYCRYSCEGDSVHVEAAALNMEE